MEKVLNYGMASKFRGLWRVGHSRQWFAWLLFPVEKPTYGQAITRALEHQQADQAETLFSSSMSNNVSSSLSIDPHPNAARWDFETRSSTTANPQPRYHEMMPEMPYRECRPSVWHPILKASRPNKSPRSSFQIPS